MIETPQDAIKCFLKRFNGNKKKCAISLGISRKTIYNWLKNPSMIPIDKAILIQEITQSFILASDLIPLLKKITK